jgi:hypothetical protein
MHIDPGDLIKNHPGEKATEKFHLGLKGIILEVMRP